MSREKGRWKIEQRFFGSGVQSGVHESGSLLWCRVRWLCVWGGEWGVGGGSPPPDMDSSINVMAGLRGQYGQFYCYDCSVLVVAGVSLVLSVQSFRKLILRVWGDPLSCCVMMLWSCARRVMGAHVLCCSL